MSAAATDYIGMWYRARARLGVDDRIEFIFIDPASGQRRTVALRHRDYDGVAGILVAAREVGMRMPMVPSGKRRKAPPFWQRWQSPAESREPAELQWRRFGVADGENNAPLVQWLNPQQTRALYQRAHQQKVSVNSLLLLALHRAVSDTLLVKGHLDSVGLLRFRSMARQTTVSTLVMVVSNRPSLAIRSTQRTNPRITTAKTVIVINTRTNRPVGP